MVHWGTPVKSIYHYSWRQKSGCTIRDPNSRKSWWKTYLFHWSTENKSWPELLHWSVEDFLTAWMSSTLSEQWLWIPARQCSVPPRKSDAIVPTTEHSDFIAADELASYSPDLNPLDYCIWNILQDLVYEGRQLQNNQQDLNEAIKNKWKEVTIETFRKFTAQWKQEAQLVLG